MSRDAAGTLPASQDADQALWPRMKPWIAFFLFLALVCPTVINYSPYRLMWDESYYSHRLICMNHAVYPFSLERIGECLAGTHKSPILELTSLPWGPIGGSESGVGLGFVGLAILIWLLVLTTYWAAIRSGFSTGPLLLAGACILLTPTLRETGGSLMADIVVGWCGALTVMLIPLESASARTTVAASLRRGLLWGLILDVGVLSKVTFGFFCVAVVPLLLYLRIRNAGGRATLYALLGAAGGSLPALSIWMLYGSNFIHFALAAAWGDTAALWSVPGMNAGGYFWRYFSGLRFALLPILALLFLFLRGILTERRRLVPAGIVLAFLGIIAMGQNRDPRYAIPVMIALPLALAWTSFERPADVALRRVPWSAGLLAGTLLAIPMVGRPVMGPIQHAEDLLARLSGGRPAVLVLATDGPDYNVETFQLARQIGGDRLRQIALDTLVYDAINKRPLEDGFRRMAAADYVLFLKPELPPGPEWSRTRADEYRAYAQRSGVLMTASVSTDFDVFSIPHAVKQTSAAPAAKPIQIQRLEPDHTTRGSDFQLQPSGQSALGVHGSDLPAASVIYWNGHALDTANHNGWLSALIPKSLYAAAGEATIDIRTTDRQSNALIFRIYSESGSPPRITSLYPERTDTAKAFNTQPNGDAALGVNGSGFLPGSKVYFAGKELKTHFSSALFISALVPPERFATAGAYDIRVVNPDGKVSNIMRFDVVAKK